MLDRLELADTSHSTPEFTTNAGEVFCDARVGNMAFLIECHPEALEGRQVGQQYTTKP
ncbi:MAG: hypothetical protein QF676_04330 [Dehalococcoidia bacterium]|jgi:hypothetical protein|nr:hypothetical protein [Dehalococcoidia bacterium]MDP7261808.1 hypothetical protein [Dehalococcoidia bacterium]MDP7486057.1 hypothetical protein [Dehalococcoidia bacterium]